MELLSQFHFLRPLWLLAAIPSLCLALLLWRQRGRDGDWTRVVAPELLPHLISQESVNRSRSAILPLLMLWLLASIAASGPSWQKLPQPVLQKQDALVIMLDLSYSMLANDLQPSRHDRVRRKLLDLLRDRREGLTALIAYAGDAHVVAPLTDDNPTIANLLPALAPAMMPLPGSNPTDAVERALALLDSAGMRRGQLLLVTDGISSLDVDRLAERLDDSARPLAILAVGTAVGAPIPLPGGGFLRDDSGEIVVPALDEAPMAELARRTGGRLETLRVDDKDLETLLEAPSGLSEGDTIDRNRNADQWQDMGHWLVLPLLIAALLAFRRGLLYALPLTLTLLLPAPDTHAWEWKDLWLRKDQQGAKALAAGDAEGAARLFDDTQWRGAAAYEAEDYSQAEANFRAGDSADDWYNLGNSLVATEAYEAAIDAYEESLRREPGAEDALRNLETARRLKEQQDAQQDPANQQQPSGGGEQESQPQQDSEQQDAADSDAAGDKQDQDPGSSDEPGDPSQTPPSEGSSDPGQDQRQESAQQSGDATEEPGSEGNSEHGQSPPLATPTPDIDTSHMQEDIERDQAMEQWLRRVPDDPSGLLREKFRYESRRRQQDAQEQGKRRENTQIW